MEASPQLVTTQPDQSRVFHLYYRNNDFVLSPEGILKVVSTVVCVVSSVLYVDSSSACAASAVSVSASAVSESAVSASAVSVSASAAALRSAAVGAALAGAAVNAALYAAAGLDLPLYAPRAWLFTDIIVTTLMGVLLLIVSMLVVTACDVSHFISYLHVPLALLTAGMMMGSAVITYKSVMRLKNELVPRLGTTVVK